MNVKKVVSRIALSFLIALGAAQTAFAGLQIELVYIENPPQPGAPVVTGGGQLREIMKVAAENWERVFKHASGNWKLTVEYGWGNLHGQFYGKEFAISERGNNPPHIGHSCVLFNADATLCFVGLDPATPAIIQTVPLPCRRSTIQRAVNRPIILSEAETCAKKCLSLIGLRSTATTGTSASAALESAVATDAEGLRLTKRRSKRSWSKASMSCACRSGSS